MAASDFVKQLRDLGYDVEEVGGGKIAMPYEILVGRMAGQKIKLGFTVPGDFPLTPPPGIHVSPRLLSNQSGGIHPNGGIHDSPFGGDWQYWSRPIHHWNQTKRSAKDVMAHVRHLFDTL